jgi:hypothetical protein
MKPVLRGEILRIAEYETVREHFRNRVIAEKKRRRVAIGPYVTCLFENHDTVLLQIQEMLRTERISREAAIVHEIDTYNQLLGGKDELGVTVMIEIPDNQERDAFLVAAKGFERHVSLVVGGARIRAVWDPARVLDDSTSAVHYFKFPLPPSAAASLRGAVRADATITHVELEVDHSAYHHRSPLPAETIVSLGEDLAE